ncbi:MAG: metallophosphoesterase [candidate division Zixibacteria bacterium]|nr:metallophosphoesterase [candidate division Zixibacteria bacterium]
MKIFVISDIHSNLEALETALRYFDRIDGDKRLVCLGDIVGYGADPSDCLNLIRSSTEEICMGNHDYAVIDSKEEEFMNTYAVMGVQYSRSILTQEQKDWLGRLPYIIDTHEAVYCHATPVVPESWDYIFEQSDANRTFPSMKKNIAFVGHSHIQGIYSEGENKLNDSKIILPDNSKSIVNVGSIGQPRDGDSQLALSLYYPDDKAIKNVRLKYDKEAASKKIIDAGLPEYLAMRLLYGV